MAKSKFSATKKKKAKRSPRSRRGGSGKKSNAWRAYVSNAPLPD
jgi:hypothetical protein